MTSNLTPDPLAPDEIAYACVREHIRQAINKAHSNMAEVARVAGIDYTTFTRIMGGSYRMSVAQLGSVARALSEIGGEPVTMADLVREETKP